MRTIRKSLTTALLAGTLLSAAAVVHAQNTVNLTATRQNALMPNGASVPMWGWLCGTGTAVNAGGTGTPAPTPAPTATAAGVTCLQTNGAPQSAGTAGTTANPAGSISAVWQPPLITVPVATTGNTSLTLTLTNNLPVATSLVIVGQIPAAADTNGLGHPVREVDTTGTNLRPQHAAQTATTWFQVLTNQAPFQPPTQGARARSFAAEAAAATTSGTTTTAGTVSYTWTNLRPGTYLIESGTYPSIQGPMGLYGVLVVSSAPTTTAAGTAYPSPCTAATAGCVTTGVQYDRDAVLLLSEIDPVQNASTDIAVRTTGFSELTKWSLACSANGPPATANTCYPPAVDFTPLYYLVNGVAFDSTNPSASQLNIGTSAAQVAASKGVLLRFVNAGLHMHMPSTVGLQMTQVAEDGNLQPDVSVGLSTGHYTQTATGVTFVAAAGAIPASQPKVVSDLFMPAGKVIDALIFPASSGAYTAASYPVFDRELSLSANARKPNSGMEAFLVVNGGATGTGAGQTTGGNLNAFATVQVNADNFIVPHLATTFSGNVLANDIGVHNASSPCVATTGSTGPQAISAGAAGSGTLNPDGSFTLTAIPATFTNGATATFTYYANGNCGLSTTVTLTAALVGGTPTAVADTYTSTNAMVFSAFEPGVLTNDTDPTGYPLSAVLGTVSGGCTVVLDPNGAFNASFATPAVPGSATRVCTFSYQAQNSQGTPSAAANVTVNFPAPSGLQVKVKDPTAAANFAGCLASTNSSSNVPGGVCDYKWIIEQDLTIVVDPACQQNSTGPGQTPPLASNGAPCPTGIPLTLGTNFSTAHMPMVASGCTGVQSCQRAQSVYCAAPGFPAGCTAAMLGTHQPAICNLSGICTVTASLVNYRPPSYPDQAVLNATNPDGSPARYYISILPGDAANSFNTGNTQDPSVCGAGTTPTGATVPVCGHTMAGAPIPTPVCTGAGTTSFACTYPATTTTSTGATVNVPGGANAPVTITAQLNPLKTATITVFVFEDDWPLNGEHDGNGAIEPGLGGFQVQVWDTAGHTGDLIGQDTYDMFNNPLNNSLNGTVDPLTGLNACPVAPTDSGGQVDTNGNPIPNQVATGVIIVCPQYESDGVTPSPLVGQAVIKNIMPERFTVIVHPSAAREAAGEEWLQTNTLDGSHGLDVFVRSGEPPYFQEFGPGGWHAFVGMANPAIINGRRTSLCNGVNLSGAPASTQALPCKNTVNVTVSNLHMSRPPNETLFDSAVFGQPGAPGTVDARTNQAFAHTTCYASLGDPDGMDFAFAKCDQNNQVQFTNIPDGNWSLKVFDQWLDLIVDGSAKPIDVHGGQGGTTLNVDFPAFTWQQHIWSNTYLDTQGLGTPKRDAQGNVDLALSPPLIQVPTRVRYRNGKIANTLFSDAGGQAHFNETFPLFNWYVVESDTTRFRGTGVHVVNDAGGQIDGPSNAALPGGGGNGYMASAYQGLLSTRETCPLPTNLRYPGSVYCAPNDPQCVSTNYSTPSLRTNGGGASPTACAVGQVLPAPSTSTGRIDPGTVETEGVQGFISQNQILEWGKMPYGCTTAGCENGGIRGHVVYASTRPFDDPSQMFQNLWDPMVPNVTVNLYQETLQPDGTTGLKLIDTVKSSSWDAYAQGFRSAGVPNMNCPGQDPNDPFFGYTLQNTANYLKPTTVNGVAVPANTLPNNSQYKCYDGMHVFNQIQPAPYDGLWEFPSPTCRAAAGATIPATASPTGQAITCATVANPAYNQTIGGVFQTGAVPAMLPKGKYVVEVIPPSGYEIEKEEDKNLLIGDNYIAPVTSQFVGLGDVFIVPDQATVNSLLDPNYANPSYGGPVTGGANPYNPNGTPVYNSASPNSDYARVNQAGFGPGGLIVMPAPCVGALRIVPDFLQISPEAGEVAPFAGSSRRLCDRREVIVQDQQQAQTDFFIWSQTPQSTHFTGFILDDFSSEFDPASPTFGEKFAVPNLPVAIKDFNGVEISRIYSDQWGIYNGMVYSSWEVNPPNITGYSPNMMINCMNDPGPIVDTRPVIPNPNGTGNITNPTFGQKITDPFFNPAYSTFCYENPFMPGDTTYLDTPVVPVSAFAEGYNPPDCEYPDATPAIKSVVATGTGAVPGPWVPSTGGTLTITSLGDVVVPNHAYSGPAANTAPYNQKTITRHYGFCPAGTAPTGTCAAGTVKIGPAPLTVLSWTDSTITATVPGGTSSPIPLCARQQIGFGGARCGELLITMNSQYGGRQSIDTVTVTEGGKRPTTYVTPASASSKAFGETSPNPLQTAIDNAAPGDLIIVGPGIYPEQLLMWKPVRLQGVGATSVIVDGNAHPAGKIDAWRRKVNCLFGLSLNGAPIHGDPSHVDANGNPAPIAPTPYDPTGKYTCDGTAFGPVFDQVDNIWQAKVDPIPLEPIIGWDANLNGNISELIQEPTLMGAYEGAGITVLAKGLENNNTANCTAESSAGCIPLNASTSGAVKNGFNAGVGDCASSSPFYTTNFVCNPSRIDGITFTDASQGGGGIFVHGWAHYMEVSNNRVKGNAGTLTGGITIGQAETADPTTATRTVTPPGGTAYVATDQLPLLLNHDVRVHNNAVTFNASFGDELNSTTPAAAGGVTFCTGSDYYHFNYNWVCGNLSSGDGGGMTHLGFSWNGDISHNAILFNQSNNPTLTTWGGGLDVQGPRPDGDLGENSLIDVDVAPALTMGIGPGLVINSNLFQGNTAESGSGGGMRFQSINGSDVINNPNHPEQWYSITVTNNIFANNVAGWAGGGVSIQDALEVNFNNNTVASNDSTATAGVLFDTLGAPNSSTPPPGCNPNNVISNNGCNNPVTNSSDQPAGFESHQHTLPLQAVMAGLTCPSAYYTGANATACRMYSIPQMQNDIFWQNRAFHITVGPGALPTIQLTPALSQAPATGPGVTGLCPGGAHYWDIGFQGDTSPASNSNGNPRLTPTTSVVGSGYAASGSASFTHQYCNGSRVPPEIAPLLCAGPTGNAANAPGCIQPGTAGVQMTAPAGAPDNNPFYPAFTLSPAATVDEGNNWINMFYGPLSTTSPVPARGQTGYNVPLGDYHLQGGGSQGASGPVPW
jgi:hypothetical protein